MIRGRTRVEASWSALALDVSARAEELVIAAVAGDALGVESRPLAGGGVRLRVFLRDPARARAVTRRVERLLSRQGGPAAGRPRLERVEDGRWVERYQQGLRPFPLGRRFLVDPTGGRHRRAGRQTLGLVPGRAFGTGEHPTTRLCAACLERLVRPGSRWADLGCGTGLLALIARRCGARRVLALDCDPVAVAVAREVLERNRAARAVTVRQGTEADLGTGRFDGIVANIGPAWVRGAARAVSGALAAGGALIVSGLLVTQLAEAARELRLAGLEPGARRRCGAWGALVLRKPARG